MWPRTLVALCLILWAETLPAAASQIQSSDCLACHNDASLVTSVQGKAISLYIPVKTFKQSVHSVLNCTDCHTDIKSIPHQPGLTKPSCGTCHSDEQAAYAQSVHGKAILRGDTPAARCVDCHGDPHRILPATDPASKGLSQQHSQHLRELSPAEVCHERGRPQHPSVLFL